MKTLYYYTRQYFVTNTLYGSFFHYKMLFYYKTSRFCYTTQQALQNTLFLLQNVAGIKKMRRLLQNAATTARVSVKNL